MKLSPLGDSAVVLALEGAIDAAMATRIHALAQEIERHPPTGLVDVVPSFSSIAVFYDIAKVRGFGAFLAELEERFNRADAAVVSDATPEVVVPVCYDGECAPDLEELAAQRGLTREQAIALHGEAEYLVHAIGFVPGFPYLGGLPARLEMPRRATPRAIVPAGSVGIGGAQTGVYPVATPGGWNLVGRTPLTLFDPTRHPAALLRAGDRVRFVRIAAAEFAEIAARQPAPIIKTAPPGAGGIEVLRAGMLTTVQDRGRGGRRAMGVPLSGAADTFALRLANLLVGNPDDAAGLEFTLVGPKLRFAHDTLVVLAGAEFGALPRWHPIKISAGTEIEFGHARSGCRGYLAVAGGIDVAPVLGSRSTYARARLGGVDGRALRDGDRLRVPPVKRAPVGRWHVDERIIPQLAQPTRLRVVRGAHADEFAAEALGHAFTASAHSDRMGIRLKGARLERKGGGELVSMPVAPGTVQVPPDGQPIVLLADAQTIGGYPQLAHVIAADLPLAAQLRPGDIVQFESVTLEQAHELALARERALAMVREGLARKFG